MKTTVAIGLEADHSGHQTDFVGFQMAMNLVVDHSGHQMATKAGVVGFQMTVIVAIGIVVDHSYH